MTGIMTIVDIGTNSVKMLVAEGDRDLARGMVPTRLGEGLHANGVLSDDAMDRTVEAVAGLLERAASFGNGEVIITGTAACRRARNTDEFARRITERTGRTLTVLSEQEEAELSFAGALRKLPRTNGNTLVIDIGGGSTELAVGVDSPWRTVSIPVGAVTATESDLVTDPPRPEDLTNVIGAVQDELEEIGRAVPEMLSCERVVGVAGTIVTVAAVELGQQVFDEEELHGFVLTREAAEDVFRTLATESLADRKKNPGLPPDRADIIVAGCCILVGFMRRLGLQEITVSTHSLRDGLAARGKLGT